MQKSYIGEANISHTKATIPSAINIQDIPSWDGHQTYKRFIHLEIQISKVKRLNKSQSCWDSRNQLDEF